jgi:hypothetical protein
MPGGFFCVRRATARAATSDPAGLRRIATTLPKINLVVFQALTYGNSSILIMHVLLVTIFSNFKYQNLILCVPIASLGHISV